MATCLTNRTCGNKLEAHSHARLGAGRAHHLFKLPEGPHRARGVGDALVASISLNPGPSLRRREAMGALL